MDELASQDLDGFLLSFHLRMLETAQGEILNQADHALFAISRTTFFCSG
jgi:hypothetical protein